MRSRFAAPWPAVVVIPIPAYLMGVRPLDLPVCVAVVVGVPTVGFALVLDRVLGILYLKISIVDKSKKASDAESSLSS